MILITTVFHTGTRSLMAMFEDAIRVHCSERATEMALSGEYEVITTYRDPVETAYSWARRTPKDRSDLWFLQWREYLKILPFAKVFTMDELDYHNGKNDRIVNGGVPENILKSAIDLRDRIKW